jgi:phospholipid transport system substrate-binding protein
MSTTNSSLLKKPTRLLARTALLVSLLGATLAGAAPANDAVTKPLKTVIGSIRYSKDPAAIKQFAGEEQGKALLGEEWAKGTDVQRKEFVQLFHQLFAKIAFPKVRENFKHLESVTYETPEVSEGRARVGSTIVILHPMKKQELKLKYDLVNDKGAWRVVDVAVLGDSMLAGIRDDQVQPLLKEGGWEALLKAMRDKAKEVK